MRSGFSQTALAGRLVARVGLAGAERQRRGGGRAPSRTTTRPSSTSLNRIGFGPRPGDVEKVRAIGLQAYIDQQLHPERIADTPMEARLAGLTTLGMSSREIAEQFAQPALEARRERKQAAGQTSRTRRARTRRCPNAGAAAGQSRAGRSSAQQKVLRAVYSERQLQEVLTDFWFNHFNVDARKGQDRFMLTEYERDAIRPHVLGTFRDLLEATAKSPAMLFYLDNWMSADPNGRTTTGRCGREAVAARRPRARPRRARSATPAAAAERSRATPRGLNENYGRELMELHTLGVDGGYTQKDVTEVARAFTGLDDSRTRGRAAASASSRASTTAGEKVVLGHVIKAGGGEADGEQVLDILAAHPSTARFIATKLARRFVSDTPPPALVDRAGRDASARPTATCAR